MHYIDLIISNQIYFVVIMDYDHFVKHDLKDVLKYLRLGIWTHFPRPLHRHMFFDPVTDTSYFDSVTDVTDALSTPPPPPPYRPWQT
jgi:hypothetical protein